MFSVYGKFNLFKWDRDWGSIPPSPPGYTPENIPTVPRKTTEIQYITMEFQCHTGNRLCLIIRGLLFNLRLSAEYQKFKVDSAHWHSWSGETRRGHVKKLDDYVNTFSD